MANAFGLFWDSISGDRVYNASSMEEWLKVFFTTGVYNGDLEVTANGSMQVNVGTGYSNLNGKVRLFDTATQFTIEPANGTYPRIDTVVIERNDTNREITMKVVTGAYSGNNPQPTAPVRTGGVYQIVLANVHVNAGVTLLTQADIEDTRADDSVCGWIVGTVDKVDVEQMTAQAQADFMAWYDAMKGQLSEDAAGHLQLQIDTINTEITQYIIDFTLSSSGWSNAQYTLTDSRFGGTEKVKQLTYPVLTQTQREALKNADIDFVAEGTGTITLEAFGDVPTIDVPIQIVVIGGKEAQ